MSDIVLHGDRLALDTDTGRRFVSDLAEFADGTISESMVRRRWRLDDATWELLGQDDELVAAIDEAKWARIRSGETKRQRAQQLVVKAPAILDSIACDDRASPRHRVDAIKALDGLATGGSAAAATESARFIIKIDLSAGGGDVEVYDKPLTTRSKDDESSDDVTTPPELLPAIASNKRNDGGHGDPL
jgi:hypothetical protein